MREGFGTRTLLTPLLAALTACAQQPAPQTRSVAEDAALIQEAAESLDRYCLGGLPDLEAIAIAMSADAGPNTGKAYTPFAGPQGFIGATLRAADGVTSSATLKDDGTVVCGVALFTDRPDAFETAVLDRIVARPGVEARDPRPDPISGTTYTLHRFAMPATLSLRPRDAEDGRGAIGAVITVAADGGALPAAAPVMAAATAPSTPPAPSAPTAAEPARAAEVAQGAPEPASPMQPAPAAAPQAKAQPVAEVALRTSEPAAPARPAPAAAPRAEAQPAAQPEPLRPSKPAPSMPKYANPPALAAAPSLYEGAPYAAFTQAQIDEFCKQDWRVRRKSGGRTEYNPCYERGAFR